MNHPGEITPLITQITPDLVMINNILPVHLENFKSLDEIADAKLEILDGLKAGGIAIFNADSEYYDYCCTKAIKKGAGKVLGFGTKDCHPREGGDPGNIKLDSRLRGNDNMPNLLAVAQTEHAFMVEEMLKNKGRDVNHKCYDDIDAHVVGDYIGTYAEVVRIIADKLGFDPYNQPAVEDIKQKSGPFPEMNRT